MRREHAPSLSLAGFAEGTVFRSIFGAYPDAMLLVDAAGQIALSNPAAETLLGYSADELSGMNVDALVPDAVRKRHASYRESYAGAPRARPMGAQNDLVAKRKDGSEVRVEIALSPLQDHGLPFVVASIRDIGDYPRVKQALKQARYSEHLAQLGRLAVDERDADVLLEHAPRIAAEALQSPSAIVLLLEDGGRQFRVAGGLGLLPGLPLGARIPATPDSPPGLMLMLGHAAVLPDYRTEQRLSLHPRYLEAGLACGVAVPLTDRGHIFGALTVHSSRIQAFGPDEVRFLESLCSLLATSLQRARTEEALNHSQRLESVGQLTGGIAHDFNNLLTVIQGNLQILEDIPVLVADAHSQRLLDAASRATKRAAELTSKLLAFSRRQVLQPAAVDVGGMLQSLADMLRRTLDQRVRIAIDVEPDCPPVLADPVQLESAVLNVAINARDAMPDGGELRLRAVRTERLSDEAQVAAGWAAQDSPGFVSISISDTGTGMTEAVRERAFEPFFTTKGVGRGTGLGLSTVYGFVTQSRGSVTIDSTPGAGTTVTMHLPQPAGPVIGALEEPAPQGSIPRGLRVLLVEDDPAVRLVALAFLEALEAIVTPCVNAEEGLLAIESDSEGFDLLLTDIALGAGMRGTELARQAQQRRPALAVLLVSGFSAELIDADQASPADWALLPKPYSRNDLAIAIALAITPVSRSPE
jgi:PAS domain S-box-containing protein